ncbi:MAG: hypothetical protein N2487_01530 [Verrucomicrobiae bacterium]|nr:hypothetical protein [Verrucomicrobiae bacterium]
MNEWKITARSHVCQSCGNSFKDKEVYHTFLFEKKHELARFDVCDVCWKNQGSPESALPAGLDKKGFISYWQGVYEVPPPPPPEPIKKETAETLLRKLIEMNNPEYSAPIFILAVMLERKKILKVKKELNENGKRIFVYEQAKTGDIFTIADSAIDFEKLGEVQTKVAHLLEHGIEEQKGETPPAGSISDNVNKKTAEGSVDVPENNQNKTVVENGVVTPAAAEQTSGENN